MRSWRPACMSRRSSLILVMSVTWRISPTSSVNEVSWSGPGSCTSEQALESDSGNVRNLANFPARRSSDGELERARELYERAVAAGPTNVDVLGNYAFFAQTRLNDAELATRLYEQALESDSGNVGNLANFADFLGQRGELERARELYERAGARV